MQTSGRLEQIYAHLRDLVASGVNSAEETLGQVLDLLSGTERKVEDVSKDASQKAKLEKEKAVKAAKDAKEEAKAKKSEL